MPAKPLLVQHCDESLTILIRDARERCGAHADGQRKPEMPLVDELLYADETLLLSTDAGHLQEYMQCVGEIGSEYGLSLNWKKIEMLDVGHGGTIRKADSTVLHGKDSTVYLGSTLSADGRIATELGRRIGLAEQVFKELTKVWSHANISRARKFECFQACVVSKLLYGLHTAWLNKAERDRLDAFHIRCLRRILKIPPSCISHVTNASVWESASSRPLSHRLLQYQLQLYGHIARQSAESPARQPV